MEITIIFHYLGIMQLKYNICEEVHDQWKIVE